MQKLMDRDLLAGLVFLVIGLIALANAGADLMNWAFPLMAAYFVLFAAVVLIARAVFALITGRATDTISVSAEDKTVWLDVCIFLLIALVYMLVLYGLGFWLSSFLMLTLASIYLTQDKTPQNVAMAIVVPFASCVMAYVLFLHVFYVPLPEAHWWPLAG